MGDVKLINDRPTKEQFKEYVAIRDSGVTNMFAVKRVCELSDTGITTDICLYIMTHFEELAIEYNVKI